MGIDIKVKTDDKNETIVETRKGLRGRRNRFSNTGRQFRHHSPLMAGIWQVKVSLCIRRRRFIAQTAYGQGCDPLSKWVGVDPPGNRLPLHKEPAASEALNTPFR